MEQKNKGFTLIELMIVIIIVVTLIAITIASLTSAKNKAIDKAIQANMLTVRTQAQLYFDGTGGGSYGPDQSIPLSNDCTIGLFSEPVVTLAVNQMKLDRGVDHVVCFSSPKTFGIVVKLKSTNDYFCIDSVNTGTVVDGNSNAAYNGMYGQGSQNGDPSVKTGVIDTNTALCNTL
ncbi:MAG: prepilin-type N-terminal cleavage/methylation domain-containing protein [Candidatus Pacebacteria bacterium]|nr:prepilin-type N-terminal cleavage/methylation domain-containing protein [Candidatus Paceibacterota bacterium]